MAGGSGERFWPLSTPERPKQLLRLTSETQTMLEEAIERAAPLAWERTVLLSTSPRLAEQVQVTGLVDVQAVVAEPSRRNTLGALVWVAATLVSRGLEDATVGVVTADHRIGNPDAFRHTVEVALETAEQAGGIVTIGMRPTRPETGYGYIHVDSQAPALTVPSGQAFRSASFREKPDRATAEQYVASGEFLWNGGMFFYTLDTFRRELGQAMPEAAAILDDIAGSLRKGDHAEAKRRFEDLPSISVDYALIEKAKDVYVVPAEFEWDDVGSWDSLDRSFPGDEAGNVIRGDTVLIDAKDCIVVNDGLTCKVGVLGVSGLVVVATPDGVLVVPKEMAQRVKEIVGQL